MRMELVASTVSLEKEYGSSACGYSVFRREDVRWICANSSAATGYMRCLMLVCVANYAVDTPSARTARIAPEPVLLPSSVTACSV